MLKKIILDAFLPQFCLNCNKEGGVICSDCLSLIEITEYCFCPFCQKPNRIYNAGKCATHRAMNLNGLFAATSYNNHLVKKLIAKFKYEPFLKTLSDPLAYLIIAHFISSGNKKIYTDAEKSLLIPIPLSKFKKRWRGFNQSEEIAKPLSQVLGISVSVNNLQKIKKTKNQIELTREQRQENIKNAFQLKNPEQIRDKIVYLVDDVFTTGATMEECSRLLKVAGALQVWGIVVAREMFGD